jgi:hypothetical protein
MEFEGAFWKSRAYFGKSAKLGLKMQMSFESSKIT